MSGGTFVWIKGPRGPYAEKWPHDFQRKKTGDPNAPVILQEHELSADEFKLSILILEQRYPFSPPPDQQACAGSLRIAGEDR
jgi:hypothetical protein